MSYRVLHGSAFEKLKELEDESVQTCVTSPPYWNLRDYQVDGQIGKEKTPEEFIEKLVRVFSEVKRVLASSGTLWVVIGDSYSSGGRRDRDPALVSKSSGLTNRSAGLLRTTPTWAKPKDLLGIPWMLAFALRADGWYLRSDIVWHKIAPMPESVKDRPTRSHETIFLLSKSPRYYYDAEAIKEPITDSSLKRIGQPTFDDQTGGPKDYGNSDVNANRSARKTLKNFKAVAFGGTKQASGGYGSRLYSGKEWDPTQGGGGNGFKGHSGNRLADGTVLITRNKRDVWTVAPKPFAGSHFAVFPPELITPCILAGSRTGDTVLDPFAGSGTTLEVAERLGRNSIGIELNGRYIEEFIHPRMKKVFPLFQESI